MTDPVQDGAVRREAVHQSAFALMQEFYLSRYYDPKPERPADNIQAAIEFALHHALSQPNATTSEMVAVPAGWKLVPVEPTEAMLHAAGYKRAPASDGSTYTISTLPTPQVWAAMLAASPVAEQADTAPSIEGGEK